MAVIPERLGALEEACTAPLPSSQSVSTFGFPLSTFDPSRIVIPSEAGNPLFALKLRQSLR
jgi:hypothetical protein